MLATLCLIACSEKDKEPAKITSDKSLVEIPAIVPGTYFVNITTSPMNVVWTVNTSEAWITLRTNYGTGNATVWFKPSDNSTQTTRTGTITVTGEGASCTITVKQAAKDEPISTNYYIKHPWGNGLDEAWTWEQMSKQGSVYVYSGLWGGEGANINTSASDNGASWFAQSAISGASGLSIGDIVTFSYNPDNSSLSVSTSTPGVQPPSTPTNLKAVVGTNSVSLTWNSVSNAASYNIYRSSNSSGSFSKIGTATSASYTDYSPLSGSNYYKVTAVNNAGESSSSSYVYVSYSGQGGGGATTKPSTPTGLKASATTYTVTVSWNSVSNATSYCVYRSSSSFGVYSKIGTSYSNSYTDPSPLNGTNYYKVTAVNTAGESAQSSSVSCSYGSGGGGVTTLSAPTGVNAAYGGAGAHWVQITWNAVAGAKSYKVYRATSSTATGSCIASNETGNFYLDKSLPTTDMATYYYYVVAVNGSVTSNKSSSASVTVEKTPFKPGLPAVTSCSATSSRLSLSWKFSTSSTSGKPTKTTIEVYNNKTRSYDVTTMSSPTSTSGSATINSNHIAGYTIVFVLSVSNSHGTSGVMYDYNTNTRKLTYIGSL